MTMQIAILYVTMIFVVLCLGLITLSVRKELREENEHLKRSINRVWNLFYEHSAETGKTNREVINMRVAIDAVLGSIDTSFTEALGRLSDLENEVDDSVSGCEFDAFKQVTMQKAGNILQRLDAHADTMTMMSLEGSQQAKRYCDRLDALELAALGLSEE